MYREAGRLPTSWARPSSWSTTGSPPARRCVWPSPQSRASRRAGRGLGAGWGPVHVRRAGRDRYEVVCPLTPSSFFAVGEWYDDFAPPSDDEIRRLLT